MHVTFMPEEPAFHYRGSSDDPAQSLYQAPLLIHDSLLPYKLHICRLTYNGSKSYKFVVAAD